MQSKLDQLGMVLSATCAVHCLLAPLLIGVLSVIGLGFFYDATTETILIAITVSLAGLNLGWSFYKKHRQFTPLSLFLLGAIVIYLSRSPISHIMLPEPIMMFIAGLSIASAHFINIQLCKSCNTCSK